MYSAQRISLFCAIAVLFVVSMVAFQNHPRVSKSENTKEKKTLNINVEINKKELEDKFFRYIKKNNTYICRTKARLGSSWGGWNLCLDKAFQPKQNDCLFYSFGIAHDWTFDDAAANQFGARVRSFDPTISSKPYRRPSKQGEIQFYHVGLTGSTERNATTAHLYSLPVLHEVLDQDICLFCVYVQNLCQLSYITVTHVFLKSVMYFIISIVKAQKEVLGKRDVDYLKFDIEGYEWGVLQDLIMSSALREKIKQIGFEIHTRHIVACGSTPGFQCIAEYDRYTRILNDLEAVGFRRWHYDIDLNCCRLKKWLAQPTHCINVNYINNKFNNVI